MKTTRRRFVKHSGSSALGLSIGLSALTGIEDAFASENSSGYEIKLESVTPDNGAQNSYHEYDTDSGPVFELEEEEYYYSTGAGMNWEETPLPANADSWDLTVDGRGIGERIANGSGGTGLGPYTTDWEDLSFQVSVNQETGKLSVSSTDSGGQKQESGVTFDLSYSSSKTGGDTILTVTVKGETKMGSGSSQSKTDVELTFKFKSVCK